MPPQPSRPADEHSETVENARKPGARPSPVQEPAEDTPQRTLDVLNEQLRTFAAGPEEAKAAALPRPAKSSPGEWLPKPSGKTGGRKWAVRLALLGLVLLLLGGGAGALVAKSNLEARVDSLLEKSQFKEALAEIDSGGLLTLPFQSGLRAKVRDGWIGHAEQVREKDPAQARAVAEEILQHFPDDPKARQLGEVAKPPERNGTGSGAKQPDAVAGHIAAARGQLQSGAFLKALGELKKAWNRPKSDAQKREIQDLAAQAKKGYLEQLLAGAESLRKDKKFADAAGELAKEKDLEGFDFAATPAGQALKVKEVRALTLAETPNLSPESRGQAVVLFAELVEAKAPRLPELCQAFLRLAALLNDNPAERNGDTMEDLERVLYRGRDVLPNSEVKSALQAFLEKRGNLKRLDRYHKWFKKAEDAYAGSAWSDCLDHLKECEKDTLKPAEKVRVEVLRALVNAQSLAGDRPAAAQALAKLLAPGGPRYRRREMCQAFFGLAGKNRDAYLAPALSALGTVLAKPASAKEKADVGRLYQQLIERAVPRLKDWKKLLAVFRQVAPNGWALACKAECLIEQGWVRVKPEDLREARAALTDARTIEAGAYGRYVRGLVHYLANERDEAAREFREAFQWGGAAALKEPHRVGRVFDVLPKLAGRYRAAGKAAAPFKTPNDADTVYHLLKTARELAPAAGQALPRSMLTSLALAAWYKKDPDVKLGDRLTDQLSKRPDFASDKDALPLLLGQIKARPTDTSRDPARLKGYEKVVTLLKDGALHLPPKDQKRDVLDPAIALAVKLSGKDPKAKPAAARFCSALGEVLYAHPRTFPDAYQEALALFSRAIRYDPTRAEYHVNRVAALSRLPRKNETFEAFSKRIHGELDNALKVDDQYAPAYAFRAAVYQGEASFLKGKPAQRVLRLKKAAAAYQKAIGLCTDDPVQLRGKAVYLTNRSNVLLQLAHADLPRKQAYFQEAVKDARAATEFDHPHRADAYGKLASLYEDLASMELEKDKYDMALTAFEKANNLKELAKYALGIGRCKYKMVRFGGLDKDLLDSGKEALQRALQGANDAEKGEALLYLAKTCALQQDHPAAQDYFTRARRHAEDCLKFYKSAAAQKEYTQLLVLVLTDWAQANLDRAALLPRADRAKAAELFRQAGELAGQLAKLKETLEAARLRGRLAERRPDPATKKPDYKKAFREYRKGLYPGKKAVAVDEFSAPLYLAYFGLLLSDKAEADLESVPRSEKPTPQAMEPKVAEMRQLVKDRRLYDPYVRAAVSWTAGKVKLKQAEKKKGTEKVKLRKDGLALMRQAVQEEVATSHHPDRKNWQKELKELER
jgi:hypothetical protein